VLALPFFLPFGGPRGAPQARRTLAADFEAAIHAKCLDGVEYLWRMATFFDAVVAVRLPPDEGEAHAESGSEDGPGGAGGGGGDVRRQPDGTTEGGGCHGPLARAVTSATLVGLLDAGLAVAAAARAQGDAEAAAKAATGAATGGDVAATTAGSGGGGGSAGRRRPWACDPSAAGRALAEMRAAVC